MATMPGTVIHAIATIASQGTVLPPCCYHRCCCHVNKWRTAINVKAPLSALPLPIRLATTLLTADHLYSLLWNSLFSWWSWSFPSDHGVRGEQPLHQLDKREPHHLVMISGTSLGFVMAARIFLVVCLMSLFLLPLEKNMKKITPPRQGPWWGSGQADCKCHRTPSFSDHGAWQMWCWGCCGLACCCWSLGPTSSGLSSTSSATIY